MLSFMIHVIRIIKLAHIFLFLREMRYYIIFQKTYYFIYLCFAFPLITGKKQIIDPLKKFLVLIIDSFTPVAKSSVHSIAIIHLLYCCKNLFDLTQYDSLPPEISSTVNFCLKTL